MSQSTRSRARAVARTLYVGAAAVVLGGSSCAQSPIAARQGSAAPGQQPPPVQRPRFTPESPPLTPPAAILALGDADPEVQRLGVQSVLDRGVNDPAWLVPIQQQLAIEPQLRGLFLDELSTRPQLLDRMLPVSVIADGLEDPIQAVRSAALALVDQHRDLLANPAIHLSVEELRFGADEDLRRRAKDLLDDSGAPLHGKRVRDLLNYGYFARNIEPLMERPGADGRSCIDCHSSHSLLRSIASGVANPPPSVIVRFNYREALKVVNVKDPDQSLLLVKPTRPHAPDGPYSEIHGGGQRWPTDAQSPEYQTALRWIRGAKAKEPAGYRPPPVPEDGLMHGAELILSPNHDARPPGQAIDTVIVHATVIDSLAETVFWFLTPASRVSAHYVVGRDGAIVQMVPDTDRAWHAGVSELEGTRGVNSRSIGIEMVNRDDGVDPYPDAQYAAVAAIIRHVRSRYQVPESRIVSHAFIARPVGRKNDPLGFDFQRLYNMLR